MATAYLVATLVDIEHPDGNVRVTFESVGIYSEPRPTVMDRRPPIQTVLLQMPGPSFATVKRALKAAIKENATRIPVWAAVKQCLIANGAWQR